MNETEVTRGVEVPEGAGEAATGALYTISVHGLVFHVTRTLQSHLNMLELLHEKGFSTEEARA